MNTSFAAFQHFKRVLKPAATTMAGNSESTHWIMRSPNGYAKVVFMSTGRARVYWDLNMVPEETMLLALAHQTGGGRVVKQGAHTVSAQTDVQIEQIAELLKPIHDVLVEDRKVAVENAAKKMTEELMNKLRGRK